MKTTAGPWIVVVATLLALATARPYAASFNDGSRLATVEALVDHHTFAIDRSIFVAPDGAAPYRYRDRGVEEWLNGNGTYDKVRIAGRFYSEKPPVQALYLAGVYQVLQWTTGLTARAHPGAFCSLMTLASSGLAYVVGVWAVWRMLVVVVRDERLAVLLTASFALGTTALPYATHVNGHLPLLAVAALLFASLFLPERDATPGRALWWGTLCGLAYTFETPTGGLLGLTVAGYLLLRYRRLVPVVLLGLGGLPWALLHHLTCYAIAGTWAPINTIPEFFEYPGSGFNPHNLTGFWNHAGFGAFALYAGQMLFGNMGFLLHNLPLLLAVPAAVLCWRTANDRAALLVCVVWPVATWLLFAALSINFSGDSLSIRWFEPLLVPGYYLLGLLVRDRPGLRRDLWILSVGGLALQPTFWWVGIWCSNPPAFWWIQAGVLALWILVGGIFRRVVWSLRTAREPGR